MKLSPDFSRSPSARERRAPTGNRKRRPPAKAVTEPHQIGIHRSEINPRPCPFCGSAVVALHEPFFGKLPNVCVEPTPGLMLVGSSYNPLQDNYTVMCAKCWAIGPLAQNAAEAILRWDLRISHR